MKSLQNAALICGEKSDSNPHRSKYHVGQVLEMKDLTNPLEVIRASRRSGKNFSAGNKS
jgi:hypothetical protein